MQVVQISIFCVLLLFICIVYQNVQAASVRVAIYDGVELLFMQGNHLLNRFTECLE